MKWYRPMTAGEHNSLRMALRDARERLIEQREMNRIDAEAVRRRSRIGRRRHRLSITRDGDLSTTRSAIPNANPTINWKNRSTLKLTVDDDAELGKRELALSDRKRDLESTLASRRQWVEICEAEPNQTVQPDYTIDRLPVVINGQIMPGDVDRFSFEARKGMQSGHRGQRLAT